MKSIIIPLLLSWIIVGCITSQVTSTDNNTSTGTSQTTDTTLTVFLLERDIPTEIKRLGVVTILTDSAGFGADKKIKEQLKQKCQELGANGAYRIADGFYPGAGAIPYLVFKYKR